jgi:hypothetical protein
MGCGEGDGTYVRGREVALLGREVYGGSDREVAALVLVEDASKDGGGVEIGNAIRFDCTDGWVRAKRDRGSRTHQSRPS